MTLFRTDYDKCDKTKMVWQYLGPAPKPGNNLFPLTKTQVSILHGSHLLLIRMKRDLWHS